MNYEVFISYKCSDDQGNKTPDVAIAQELYTALTDRGYSTFFSSNTLELMGSSRYKADIDAALDSAKVMIVVLSKEEYASSHWVQYEWDSFYNDYLSGIRKEANLFTFTANVDIHKLPRTLRNVQNFDYRDGISRICDCVQNAIPRQEDFNPSVNPPDNGEKPISIITGKQVTLEDIAQAVCLDALVYEDIYHVDATRCEEWFAVNPDIYVMAKDNKSDKIIAYVNISPVTDECYNRIKRGDFIDTGIIRIVKILEFLVIYGYFFMINKYIFVVSIIISIVSVLIILFRGPKTEKYNFNRKVTLDNYISTVNDTFMGMKEIKSLHILDKVKERVVNSNDEYLSENKNYNIYYQGGNYFILSLIEIVRYALLIYGIYLISIGQFQLGSIILIYNYYQKMVENFTEICTMNVEYRNFKVSIKRINKVFEYSEQEKEYTITDLENVSGTIEFKDILYGNRQDPILRKVSFEINPNSITTITGKIGSGKSGIFDLLMRINRQHEGTIKINNIDINDIDQNLYYNVIALARKTPTFFNMSILDNLKLVENDEDKIYTVCSAMKIDSLISNLSEGYNTSINSREVNTELRQMLGIARVFVKNPEIMLFDEIIDTLDDNNKETVLSLLKRLKQKHTILIISRSNDMLDFADKVITMERNTIKKIEEK